MPSPNMKKLNKKFEGLGPKHIVAKDERGRPLGFRDGRPNPAKADKRYQKGKNKGNSWGRPHGYERQEMATLRKKIDEQHREKQAAGRFEKIQSPRNDAGQIKGRVKKYGN